jgi:hypothetical protein
LFLFISPVRKEEKPGFSLQQCADRKKYNKRMIGKKDNVKITISLKGQCHEIFCFWFLFMNQFPPSSRVFHLDHFEFFQKFSEIFASQGAPPVSSTPAAKLPPVSTTPVANLPPVSAIPVANFSTIFAIVVDAGGKFAAGVNDTGGKFATGVNDAGGKLPPVSTTKAANLPPVSLTPVANNGNNIRLQTA